MGEIFDTGKISKTIVDIIDDHILVCNQEGQIVYANKVMLSYLGYDDIELKEKNFLDIITDIHKNKGRSYIENISDKPSGCDEFLFNGKHNVIRLHIKFLHKNNLIYIYGNEKYVEYERIREKLDREITNAMQIHKRSLPESLPNTENISFASLYIPAEKLGGDLFDVFKVDNGLLNDYFEQYICFISDVSGHGLDSAMLSIFIKDTIRSYFRLRHIPGQLISPKEIMHFLLKQYIKEGYPEEYLVCLFLIVFDLKTNELTYCNAGFHNSPLLVMDGNEIIELNNGTFPITTGIDVDLFKYKDYSLHISRPVTLFIMSDGLMEQRANGELYEARLKENITKVHYLSPVNIVQKIKEDFDDFLRHEKISDDITLVVVKLS